MEELAQAHKDVEDLTGKIRNLELENESISASLKSSTKYVDLCGEEEVEDLDGLNMAHLIAKIQKLGEDIQEVAPCCFNHVLSNSSLYI